MAAPSRSGWHDFTKEERFCAECGEKLILTVPGGIHFQEFPKRRVFHSACANQVLRSGRWNQ